MNKPMYVEPISEIEFVPPKLAKKVRLSKAKQQVKLEKPKLRFRSLNETYDLDNFPGSAFFSGIEINCNSHGCFEAYKAATSRYLNLPVSTVNLNSIRLNRVIKILKSSGILYNIYDCTYHGDKANSIFLCLKDSDSEIFIWTEDVKYIQRKSLSKIIKKCSEEDFVDDQLVIAGSITLFFKTGDNFAYDLANKLFESASVEDEHEQESYIEMVVMGPHGLSLKSVKLDTPKDFDLALHYGDGFVEYNDKLLDRLSSKNKGVVMLHGPPGTGKTHYIRSLLPKLLEMGKHVVLIPKHVLSNLESPQFNSFMIENFTEQSTVFVIEDAESIISKRDAANGYRSELVSTILNITDGILNDVFNIQVILTFNTELNSIDEALLRKGRLISKYEFGLLGRSQATALANSLGYNLVGNNSKYSLADIYSLSDSEEDEVLINQNLSKQKSFVGF